jgi:recombinational DNA repair ATPase RecF
MKKETRLLIFTIAVSLLSIAFIVLRYEKLLQQQRKEASLPPVKNGAAVTELTAAEIIEKIKASKEYLGDSITIFEDGKMTSSNAKFQGTINAVVNTPENMEIVKSNSNTNRLSLQYNIYVLAATYYKSQYPDEFK